MTIIDKIHQRIMIHNIRKVYDANTIVQKGVHGSLYIPSELKDIPSWTIDGPSDFDRFIKRYGMSAVGKNGKLSAYTMASRGTEIASKNVTMIMPEYKDILGRKWIIIQEEARPIDLVRRGCDARILAFPAGIIGDEAKFASESVIESAVRELSEETGLIAKKIINIIPEAVVNGTTKNIPIMTSPGLTDESTHFFKAFVEKLKPSQKALTDGVTTGWYFVPAKKISKWLTTIEKFGKIPSGQTLTTLALSVLHKGKIRI